MNVQTRNSLYGTVAMTAAERSMGRFMRAPDHPGGDGGAGGGDSGGPQNNTGGENNGEGGSSGTQNNGGQNAAELENFWSDPSPSPTPSASNNGESAGGNQGGGGSPSNQGGNDEASAFANALAELKFGEVFTPEAVKAMNEESDPKIFNQNLQKLGQDSVRQAVLMSARLMGSLQKQIESRFEEMIQQRLGERDAQSDLSQEIPSYKDPKIRPTIDRIFAQAQKHHPKDRAKAIQVTKDMLRIQIEALGGDFGIGTPPNGPGDQLRSTTNWEKELLGVGDDN